MQIAGGVFYSTRRVVSTRVMCWRIVEKSQRFFDRYIKPHANIFWRA